MTRNFHRRIREAIPGDGTHQPATPEQHGPRKQGQGFVMERA